MATDAAPLASLSLTHVHYDPTDPISYLSALLALLPQSLCLTYAILLYTTREVEVALAFAGQLACEALNFALKRYFKRARPPAIRHLGKGYGMPSSHAQFVAFFAAYVALWAWLRHVPAESAAAVTGRGREGETGPETETRGDAGTETETKTTTKPGATLKKRRPDSAADTSDTPNTPSETTSGDRAQTTHTLSAAYRLQLTHPRLTHALLSLAACLLALATAASRVYLHYHTVAQVLVGCAAGASFAGAWFGATSVARRLGWVEWALGLWVVRAARVRDLCCEEDLVEIGWRVAEEKRLRRGRRRRRGGGGGKGE